MSLTVGARLGTYEVVGLLGAGGMGEVYRAVDTRLDRQVAIKVLPEAVRADPERVARFEREAKLLASLNHPNIAGIYGLEQANSEQFIVMELVEGDTLAEVIARRGTAEAESLRSRPRRSEAAPARGGGARTAPEAESLRSRPRRSEAAPARGGGAPRGLEIEDALQIAKQIADALEAAHESGVIHRDLKPANVKVRPDGTVKVLDFGLAKAMEPAGALSASVSISPTITTPAMTQAGMILGTAAYMSPEQAKGKAADKRSDVWAFGCVLYEMLTGKRPFEGEDVSDTLAFVLTKEPDWGALPAGTPPSVGTLLRRCLDKDRRKRVGDISIALFVIDEARVPGTAANVVSPSLLVPSSSLWRRLAMYSAPALIAGLAMAGGGVWFATRPVPPRVSRLAITMTPTTALTINGVDRDVALTPDGSRVIYVGNGGRELFVRPLDALEPTSLFTGAPRAPFVSPDGEWVGFVDGTSVLKKVALTGGPPFTIATLDGVSRGATWTLDDTIVFATNSTTTGLQQVSPGGGTVTVITRPDLANGEFDHLWPEQLPDGRTLLFTINPLTGGLDAAQVVAVDRKTGTQRVLVRGGSHAHYVRSGHLIYAAANTLRAVAFDPFTLETRGTSHPVASEVVTTGTAGGGVDAVVASDGTLAYVRGIGSGPGPRSLVWVDREGRETPSDAPPRPYMYPRIRPDGGRVVASILDGTRDLWSWDFARLTLSSLMFATGQDLYPVWTPDGQRIIFASERQGTFNLYRQAADGTGVERLTSSTNVQFSTAVSPDGTRVIFTEVASATSDDVMQMELTGTRTVTPLVQSPAVERNGIVSPDGRWLAYEADDRGQLEIYVRPYPDVHRGVWQVSTGGGTRPLWSPNSQELFYVSPAGAIMRAGVLPGASWVPSTPTTIVKNGHMPTLTGFVGRTYDISPDGVRFLVIKATTEPNAQPPQLVVVQHFDEELKRLVPTK